MNKPKNIFISYLSEDQDKVDILEQLVKDNGLIPIIVAKKKEAQKSITSKVIDSIEKSDFVVPILTRRSITAQYMNQEIGYSLAQKKKVVSIVEIGIMDNLKGFIHNQIDLPYNYIKSDDSNEENLRFQSACELLISDIMGSKAITIPIKSRNQTTLDKAESIKNAN